MTMLAQAISTALLDLVWQGALIGAGLWLALALLRHQAAGVRYAASCFALLLLAVLPLATMATVWSVARGAVTAGAVAAGAAASGAGAIPRSRRSSSASHGGSA